jgi:serine/threonine-protein kinase
MSDTLSSADTHVSQATSGGAPTRPGTAQGTVLPRVAWDGPVPQVTPSSRLRFEELDRLGVGGMGEVVLAKDHDIERTVAVKRLPENADLGRVLRFVEEIRTVGQLEHPNIVPVHDVGVDASGRYYFVMKHLRGETLERLIERLRAGDAEAHARYPMATRVQLVIGILHALAHAHEQGFIHRDLKPANVMVGPHGEVTVMDWGLAKRLRGAAPSDAGVSQSGPRDGTVLETRLGAVIGTPLYMSPEQARGAHDEVDVRSDLYAVAVLFHELLHLEHYLHDRTELQSVLDGVQHFTPQFHQLTLKGPEYQVPAELDWFLERGLRKKPDERFQSAQEMIDELQRIVRGECRVQCQRTFVKRALGELARLVDRRPVAVILGSTLVATVLLAAVVQATLRLFG